jgi:hypothetical protein
MAQIPPPEPSRPMATQGRVVTGMWKRITRLWGHFAPIDRIDRALEIFGLRDRVYQGLAAVMIGATYAFWEYLQDAEWDWLILAGCGAAGFVFLLLNQFAEFLERRRHNLNIKLLNPDAASMLARPSAKSIVRIVFVFILIAAFMNTTSTPFGVKWPFQKEQTTQELSSAELKRRALLMSRRMHTLANEFERSFNGSARERDRIRKENTDNYLKTIYPFIRPLALEILKREGKQVRFGQYIESHPIGSLVVLTGNCPGPNPMREAANFVDDIAKELPL